MCGGNVKHSKFAYYLMFANGRGGGGGLRGRNSSEVARLYVIPGSDITEHLIYTYSFF